MYAAALLAALHCLRTPGCSEVLPVHYQHKSTQAAEFTFSRSQLMQLTIAALPRGSEVMW